MEVVDIDVEANQGAKSFEASGTGQGQSQGRRGFFAPLAQAKSKIQSVKAWGKGKIKPVDDGESELLKKISAYTDKQLHAGEALQHLKEKKRFNFDMQFGIYIVHFCFFLATVLLFIPVHFSFEQVDLVTIYFSQDQNEEYLNIESVTTKGDIYKFLSLTVIPGLLNSIDYNKDEENSLRYSQTLIGMPLLRQVRVKPSDCQFNETYTDCYGFFDSDKEEKRPFGPNDDYKWTDGHPYMYPSNAFYRDIHSGIQGPYGRGAYDLIMDPNDENIISRLQEHNWIDRPTRAVAINFAFFNADLGFVTAVEYLFEISPTGRIEPTRRVTSYPIMRKGDTTKMSIFVVFCVITMFWFYYEGKQMIHDFRQYISSSWNKIEIVNIALFTGLVIMLGVYVDESANAIEMLELTGRETGLKFYDFQTASYLYFTLQQLVGTCVLFYFVKVFKFFRAFRKLNLLWRTLELASGTLKAYSVTFIIMFIAFSLQGYYLFGFQLRTFHTFPISILTAFRLLSGDFDFSNMQTTSPILGPVFFMAYMIFVFLILINLFIAILSQYYEAASREAAEAEKLGFGGNTEYELTTRLYNARPRIVLSKKYRFLALEQNTYVAVVLSHHDIQFDVKESDRFRVLYMRSDAFSNENLMLLLGEKSIECCVQDCEEEYNFALDKIEVDASTAKDNGDDLEEVRRHLHRLREYKDVSVNLYRMDGYCRMTKDAVISIPYGILLQMFHMKMGRVFHSVFTSKPKEFSILSDQQVEKMLERLCSGKLANKGDYGLILDMSSAAFKKELEDLEKELSADGRFDKLSLADILDQLKSKQSQAKVMMRFDELVREIRLAVALLRKSGGKGTYATADIMRDALRIFETMPKSCFYTINKEEAAKQYEPRVYNTSGVDIEFMIPLIETIAEHVHDNWTLTKLEQGWRYGPKRNNDDKVHPAMIPYEELTENEKSYDKNMAKEAVKLIITLGYKIDKGAKIETNFVSIKEEYKERLPPNYVLKIVDTSAAPLDQTILELSDIIAENVHNEWAKKRLEEGLIYAPEGSKVPNSSPFLLPYFMMTKKEREADQRTALETLRIIAVHGYRIHKPESSTFWTRMPSWFKYRSTGA